MPTWTSALLSYLHILAFGLGLAAVYVRGRGLRDPLDTAKVLNADNLWGVAAILWIGSGLARAFGPFEKGAAFYLSNPLFHAKMGLLLLAMLLEMWPMVTFIRWRMALSQGKEPDLRHVPLLRRINAAEVAIILILPLVAAGMARGLTPTG